LSEARAILSWRRVMARAEVNGSLHFDRAIGFYWQAIGKAEQTTLHSFGAWKRCQPPDLWRT
jgi:hypothetical protein